MVRVFRFSKMKHFGKMDAVNSSPLHGRHFEGDEESMQSPLEGEAEVRYEDEDDYDDGDDGIDDDVDGGGDQMVDYGEETKVNRETLVELTHTVPLVCGPSELTMSFQGEVYVFHAVTPQKVKAVLLLLGAGDQPTTIPTFGLSMHQSNQDVVNGPRCSNNSGRNGSLIRFREKRKERNFDKKIRYTSRRGLTQSVVLRSPSIVFNRMHRKNGQFASSREIYGPTAAIGWETWKSVLQCDGSPCSEIERIIFIAHDHFEEKLFLCYICFIAMRRGPSGPRSLCNACGLMWANKGTLRDLSKSGRNLSYDQNEQDSSVDNESLTTETQNVPNHKDELETFELITESKYRTLNPDEQETSEDLTKFLPIGVENPSADLNEQTPDYAMETQSLWGDGVLPSDFWDFLGTTDDLDHESIAEVETAANLICNQSDINGGSLIASCDRAL